MEVNVDKPPGSIVIVGGGAFGLSTLHALLTSGRYASTAITVVDAHVPPPNTAEASQASFATASLDSSRIVRPDYADAAYSALATRAHAIWRTWPRSTYHEPGLLLSASAAGNPRAPAYLAASRANVARLQRVQVLPDGPAIVRALAADPAASPASLGEQGYLNADAGVADAARAIQRVREECVRLAAQRPDWARLRWVHGRAERLLYRSQEDRHAVCGAVVEGEELLADLTVVAAGAWSAALLPRSLGPRLRAQAQALAYLRLDEREAQRLRGRPVVLNISTGIFAIAPPPEPGNEKEVLKIAQHAFGYHHAEQVEDTEPGSQGGKVSVSVPAPASSEIPPRSRATLDEYLTGAFPELGQRAFDYTRTCWYTDTGTGDYIVDFVPKYGKSVLVVTGGSGHGFKMLPVLGEWVLKRLEGRLHETQEGEEVLEGNESLGVKLARQWRWRSDDEVAKNWEAGGDGSRGGDMGLVWDDEVKY